MLPSWAQPCWRNWMTFLLLASKRGLIYLFPKPVNPDEKILLRVPVPAASSQFLIWERAWKGGLNPEQSYTNCVLGAMSVGSHAGSHLPPLWLKSSCKADSCRLTHVPLRVQRSILHFKRISSYSFSFTFGQDLLAPSTEKFRSLSISISLETS